MDVSSVNMWIIIANTYTPNSFKELKIALNMAENEREGGLSPNFIPLNELSELGNLLSRTQYKLTTLNVAKYSLLFKDFSQILDFIKAIGENNFLINRRKIKSRETFIAASAIYKTLFNKKNYRTSIT
jgi:NADH dehydrogenase [ubiquinone] 1 alpha subcomplex assembly factor 5